MNFLRKDDSVLVNVSSTINGLTISYMGRSANLPSGAATNSFVSNYVRPGLQITLGEGRVIQTHIPRYYAKELGLVE